MATKADRLTLVLIVTASLLVLSYVIGQRPSSAQPAESVADGFALEGVAGLDDGSGTRARSAPDDTPPPTATPTEREVFEGQGFPSLPAYPGAVLEWSASPEPSAACQYLSEDAAAYQDCVRDRERFEALLVAIYRVPALPDAVTNFYSRLLAAPEWEALGEWAALAEAPQTSWADFQHPRSGTSVRLMVGPMDDSMPAGAIENPVRLVMFLVKAKPE